MKAKDIAELLDEPACTHNKKEKSGCAKPTPGATDGGCAFDGAQIALLPIADVAHIVHGPIACAGSSWDNRGTRSSGPQLYRIGMTTDLSEQDVIMGRAEKRLFHAIRQAVESYAPPAVFVYNTCVPALIGDDLDAVEGIEYSAQAGADDRMVVDKHDAKCHFSSTGRVAARTLPSTVSSPPASSTRARRPCSPYPSGPVMPRPLS